MATIKDKLQHYFLNHKNDIIGIAIFIAVYFFLLLLTWQRWGSPVIDCGRELYVGEQILNGTRIYSEIFYNYGPLSPYVMSFLFSIFGIHLDVAYNYGMITALCTIICIYLINRQFFTPMLSTVLTITSVYLFFFNPKIHNFIFPYTYSATNGALISFLFLFLIIYIINYRNYKLIPLLGALCGLNIINKIEYGFTLTILLFVFSLIGYRFYKKCNLKFIFMAWGFSIIIPLITSLYLIHQSGITSLLKFSEYYNQMVASEPFKYFNYTEMFGLKSFSKTILTMPEAFLYLLFLLIVINILVFIFYRSNFKFFIYIFSLLCWFLLGFFYNHFPAMQLKLYQIKIDIFSFSAIFCSIVSLYHLFKFIRTRELAKNDFFILILSLFIFLISMRSYFRVEFMGYGCYHMPILVIIIYYLILKGFNLLINNHENIPKLKYHLYGSLIVLHILTLSNLYSVYLEKNTPITTNRGTIYTFQVSAKALNSLIMDINKYTDKNDPIFIAPEEILIYFLSERKSVSQYYDYLPLRLVNAQLENSIINLLKTKKVKIIAISNRPTFEYIYPFWGINYDQAVFNWINNNYKPVASYGDYFSIYRGAMVYGVNIYTPKSIEHSR